MYIPPIILTDSNEIQEIEDLEEFFDAYHGDVDTDSDNDSADSDSDASNTDTDLEAFEIQNLLLHE